MMTVRTMENALEELRAILGTNVRSAEWRYRLRQSLGAVREALGREQFQSQEAWLAARCETGNREKHRLMGRVSQATGAWLDMLETDRIFTELTRLANDIERHHHRIHDLVYDSFALELGGSE